jgi:DNA mismatch repair protein MutL
MQYLFLNGRWIRDRSLGHAMQEAYHGLLMTGRYCIAFLFLELPPDHVDVNVHPTKAEVRFRDSQAVYHLVLSTIRDCLRSADLTATMQIPRGNGLLGTPLGVPMSRPMPLDQPSQEREHLFAPAAGPQPVPSRPLSATSTEARSDASSTFSHLAPAPFERPGNQPSFPSRAIQLHDSYLVLETREGMLVIDQHALHERIIYEDWKGRIARGQVETQQLLVPEPVDLPADQAAVALEHRAVLGQLGLGVEDFGGGTVLLSSYPAMSAKAAPNQLLRTAVEYLTAKDRAPTTVQLMDDLLKMMSCKAAVKAGDRLTPEEIEALIAQRHLVDDTHHCPHGRPTALLFSKQELDRQFKRT